MQNYHTKSPILFLIFNRPDCTNLVFEQIRRVKPSQLYIAADGARSNIEGEDDNCQKTREISNKVDWDCELKLLFRTKNLGCKYAVSSAIDWFFENEEQGIILEDDCLPTQDFFIFCDQMLSYYKYDSRIYHIGGSNLQMGNIRGNTSYYFSNLTHVWGWASWRRAWQDYNVELSNYKELDTEKMFNSIFHDAYLSKNWNLIFLELLENKIDTWDFQWAITNMFNNGLSIIPNNNLISNIGFGQDATHTHNENDDFSNLPTASLGEVITHPISFLPDKEADSFTLKKEFIEQKVEVVKTKKSFKFWKKN